MALTEPLLPLLVEPSQLARELSNQAVLIVDLCGEEDYARGHIPGAVPLAYRALVRGAGPTPGKLPEPEQLSAAFSAIGLEPRHHVVAYDNEGGGRASRLSWTLDMVGHTNNSVLNGGIRAWAEQGYPLAAGAAQVAPSRYAVSIDGGARAAKEDILARLGDPTLALLDARTPEEYRGTKIRAAKAGHIPGAVNLNWIDTMDGEHSLRLLPDDVLMNMLAARGVTMDKDVVVYCHTHHRSAHSYVMLKHLGFKVRGYDGSWSEWGNDPHTPVESGS